MDATINDTAVARIPPTMTTYKQERTILFVPLGSLRVTEAQAVKSLQNQSKSEISNLGSITNLTPRLRTTTANRYPLAGMAKTNALIDKPTIQSLTGSLGGIKTQIRKAKEAGNPVPPALLEKKADLKRKIANYNQAKKLEKEGISKSKTAGKKSE